MKPYGVIPDAYLGCDVFAEHGACVCSTGIHGTCKQRDSMRVYAAGPMRGYDQWNFPAFDEASAAIRERYGFEVVSPAEMDRELGFDETAPDAIDGFDLADAIQRDVAAITGCDGIVLLPGWEKSTGTAVELAMARFLNLKVMYWVDGELWEGVTGPDLVRVVPTLPPTVPQEVDALVPGPGPIWALETRVVDPVTGGAKGQKLARMDLLPWDALVALSEHYGKGAQKYTTATEDGGRNWERGYAWSLSFAAAQRHAAAWFQGENVDAEGFSHLSAWAWHSLNLLAMSLRDIGTDDRPALV